MLNHSDLLVCQHGPHPSAPELGPMEGELPAAQAAIVLSLLAPGGQRRDIILDFWDGQNVVPASPLTIGARDERGRISDPGDPRVACGPWRFLRIELTASGSEVWQSLHIEHPGLPDEIEWPHRIIVPDQQLRTWTSPDAPHTVIAAPSHTRRELLRSDEISPYRGERDPFLIDLLTS